MKFGVREICDVVLKAKANQKIGNKMFYKNEPVIYFDTLKTSSMEGAATTVYAQGGRGNARLMAWEGERTVTFTMEDALISPEGFMILSGAGLVEASEEETIKQHITQTVEVDKYVSTTSSIEVDYVPYDAEGEHYIYVFLMKDGDIISEPYIGSADGTSAKVIIGRKPGYTATDFDKDFANADSIMIDYYTERKSGAKQIEITADKFGGNYYLEAATLFRTQSGVDMPAEFIIPNCKIQSNFTFTMASTGDPSTFTFTMDAFPDYTRFDHTKKVLAAIQIIEENDESDNSTREKTWAGESPAVDCVVRFDLGVATDADPINPQLVPFGSKVDKPIDPSSVTYSTFDGWFSDAVLSTPWNFDTASVAGNMTLYAKWTA